MGGQESSPPHRAGKAGAAGGNECVLLVKCRLDQNFVSPVQTLCGRDPACGPYIADCNTRLQ